MTRFPPNWLQQGTYAASVDRRLPAALWTTHPYSPAGGLVTVASGMTVNVNAGQVAIPTSNNTGTVLCTWDALEQVTLAAAPASGSNRIDLIVAQARGNDLDGGANNDFVMVATTGTAAASPTAPAVPNNAAALAQVYVPGASASVTAGNITDRRWPSVGAGTVLRSAPRTTDFGWAGTPVTAAFMTTPALWMPGGHKVRVDWAVEGGNAANQTDMAYVQLLDNGAQIGQAQLTFGGALFRAPAASIVAQITPTAGLHTYTVTASGTSAGNYNLRGGATYPMQLTVTDAGL